MSNLENTRKSSASVFHSDSSRNSCRNFRRGVAALALSLGILFSGAAPAAAAGKKLSQERSEWSTFGQLLNDFLAAVWPGWADARELAGEENGFTAVISRSEGDSEIEIEPRNPRVPPPPPPVNLSGPQAR